MFVGKQLSRREVSKMAVSGALGATALGWLRSSSAQEHAGSAAVPPQPTGIQLACDIVVNAKDEDLLFFKQAGVDVVCVRQTKPEDQTVEGLLRIKKRFADAGLMVNDFDNQGVNANLGDIVLNRPGRDKAIEAYKSWIRTLGQAGVSMIEAIMYNATASVVCGQAEARGATHGREFDLNSSELTGAPWRLGGRTGSINSLLFGREYSQDEIWENYTYFIKQVSPVAEEAGVRIPFDPDDPAGLPSVFGVPRIFSTFEGCKKALKIANSPNVGMCLGCGPWLEGGAANTGIDVPGFIHHLASQKQLFHVYGRNPSSPLPRTHETYIDDGYYDMYKIIKALVDVKYNRIVTLDHNMGMVGGLRTYQAFGLGYLRAMLQCAQRGYHA
jgi:mannonate dehydratase